MGIMTPDYFPQTQPKASMLSPFLGPTSTKDLTNANQEGMPAITDVTENMSAAEQVFHSSKRELYTMPFMEDQQSVQ